VGKHFVEGHLFTLLPSPQSRWKSFVTGWSVQALSVVTLVAVSVRFHQSLIPPADYKVTNLVSYEPVVLHPPQPIAPPVVTRSKPAPESKPFLESKPLAETKPAVATLVVTPQTRALPERKLQEPERPAPQLNLANKMPDIPAAPVTKVVAVGTFAANNPAGGTAAAKPDAAVRTGGFGDPNGVPASSGHHAAANIREAGSFDLPAGSGHGNGGGGTNSNVVMSSGFGNGAIDPSSSGVYTKTGSHQAANGPNTPVEITFKPKPDYTDEGRKQKINGEVRLEVMFKSDGRVHVVRVLQGLGYGLDEQAVKAAEQIKFKPALHEGQPVDSMAQIHIIFELIS
jgi:TonB family protein